MFKKINYLFLFLFILLLSSMAYAASFEVTSEPIIESIVVNEVAIYTIEVENNLETKQEFRIYTLDYPFWDIRTEPIINPITLEVGPESKKSIDILVDPLHITQVGAYVVGINVQSLTNQEKKIIGLEVGIKSTDPLIGGYVPTVVTSVSIPGQIDPRKEIPIKINLNNQNDIDYHDMVIKIESKLLQDTIDYKLGPREEKTLSLTKKLDSLTSPQKDNIVVNVFKGERSIANIVKQIEIVEYGILDEVDVKKGFLRTSKELLFTSNNKNYEGKTRVETTFFKALFTSTSPKSESIKENGKKYLVWDISLQNTNSLKITVTENLLPLFIIIILILVLMGLYYSFRSPLTIKKEANSIKKKDGGISELKVVLHIRNRSKKPLSDIDLTERVPHLVHVEKEVSIGTLQPEKILRHEDKDTVIKWKIDSLDPQEERVLTYKVGSRLPILGSFTLPAAGCKFVSNNNVSVASSNRLNVEG